MYVSMTFPTDGWALNFFVGEGGCFQCMLCLYPRVQNGEPTFHLLLLYVLKSSQLPCVPVPAAWCATPPNFFSLCSVFNSLGTHFAQTSLNFKSLWIIVCAEPWLSRRLAGILSTVNRLSARTSSSTLSPFPSVDAVRGLPGRWSSTALVLLFMSNSTDSYAFLSVRQRSPHWRSVLRWVSKINRNIPGRGTGWIWKGKGMHRRCLHNPTNNREAQII